MNIELKYPISQTLKLSKNGYTYKSIQRIGTFVVKKYTYDIKDLSHIEKRIQDLMKLDESKWIPRLRDFKIEKEFLYLVFDFHEGQDLKVAAERLTNSEKEKVGNQIIKALKWMHQKDFIHGDISYTNIIIDNNLIPIFIDPAVFIGGRQRDIGTLNFIAPELLNASSSPTHESDLYSSATCLYYLFENNLPETYATIEEFSLFVASQSTGNFRSQTSPRQIRNFILHGSSISIKKRAEFHDSKNKNLHLRYLFLPALALGLLSAYFIFKERQLFRWNIDLKGYAYELDLDQLQFIKDIGKAPFYLRENPFSTETEIIVCNAHSPYLSIVRFDKKGTPYLFKKFYLDKHFSHDIAFLNREEALVTSSVSNSVLLINLKAGKVSKIIDGAKWFLHPDAIVISKKHQKAFVTSWKGAFLTVIDLIKLEPIKKISVYAGPSGATLNQDESKVFLSHTEARYNPSVSNTEGVVSVINTKTLEVTKEIPNSGKASSDIKNFNRTPLVLAANFRGQSISYFDSIGLTQLDQINLNLGTPIDLYISDNLKAVFVANLNHPLIHIIDASSKQFKFALHHPQLGKETNGILYLEKNHSVCLTNTASNELVCVPNINKIIREFNEFNI